MKSLILAFLSSLLFVGCASESFQKQAPSVLDGTWRQVFTGCVNGDPTPEEQKINEALHNGQVTSRLRVTGTSAEVELITREKKPAERDKSADPTPTSNESYCKLLLTQRWNVIGSHVEVTDLKIKQQGFNGNTCKGSPSVHDPRVHNYVLQGDRLMVYMNSMISLNSIGDSSAILPSQCAKGEPETVVFRRIP